MRKRIEDISAITILVVAACIAEVGKSWDKLTGRPNVNLGKKTLGEAG